MDGIHHGLNDDRFAALCEILYDKTEEPEVLDAFLRALHFFVGIKSLCLCVSVRK